MFSKGDLVRLKRPKPDNAHTNGPDHRFGMDETLEIHLIFEKGVDWWSPKFSSEQPGVVVYCICKNDGRWDWTVEENLEKLFSV